jgi:hypothetical protein
MQCADERVSAWTHFSPFRNERTIMRAKRELPTYFSSYHEVWELNGEPGWHAFYRD